MIGKCNTGGVDMATPVNAQTVTIEQIQESLVGKAQGANATADKILEGYSAYVGQELLHGTAKDVAAAFGYTRYAVDKITYPSRTKIQSLQIPHSLGVEPKLAIMKVDNFDDITVEDDVCLAIAVDRAKTGQTVNGFYAIWFPWYRGGYFSQNTSGNGSFATDSLVLISNTSYEYFAAGIEYTLITMA